MNLTRKKYFGLVAVILKLHALTSFFFAYFLLNKIQIRIIMIP